MLNLIKTYLVIQNNKIKYYDFSKKNGLKAIKFLRNLSPPKDLIANIKFFGNGVYIPYKENIEETSKLKSFMNVNKIYDICIVGKKSKRRCNIVTKLQEYYRVIHIYNLYGDKRDALIGKYNILLNDQTCYESIRCERWRFAKMLIISELCSDVLPDDII